MVGRRPKRGFASVSLPVGIVEEIDRLIDELGYWPSRGAFVREACLEKIRQERRRLGELREARARRAETRGTKEGISPR